MKEQSNKSMLNKHGFTLMELLVVISVIAITAAVGFVALDPASRLDDAKNSARWTDVSAVLNAIKTDQIDNGGSYLASIAAIDADADYVIGTSGTDCDSGCSGATTPNMACVNLAGLVTEGYMGTIPVGPDSGAVAGETSYFLRRLSTGGVKVTACASTTIAITR